MQIAKKQDLFLLLLFFSFIILVGVMAVPTVQAGSLWDSQTGMNDGTIGKAFGESSGEPKDIRIIIAMIINVFLGFMGIIMVLLFVWAGYKWMTSQGNEQTVGEAKAQIRTAIIGLIIILMSYSIAAYVTQCLYDIVDGSMSTILCN